MERLSRDDLITDDFFELSLDPMIVVGFDGFVKRANRACLDLTGLTEKQLLATPYLDLIHPDDKELLRRADQAVDSVTTTNYEVRVLHVDGSVRWVRWATKS